MKKLFVLMLAVVMMLSLAVTASADVDFSGYAKGVTVEADASSPTGYTATFVYEEQGDYVDLTGVALYSDCMMHFDPAADLNAGNYAANGIAPENYVAGIYPGGGNGDSTYTAQMVEFADGLWGVQIPLSSGAFVYNFAVTFADGTTKSRLDDPNNPTLVNSATGIRSLSSLVYIPYNAETMGDGEWADRSLELPYDGSCGVVETVAYIGADGTDHGLAVYLPADYDAERAEPYNVLYLSHGTSGDIYGDELRWMNEGAVANIMNNLVGSGAIDSFVVVTMNNQQYGQDEGHSGANWNYNEVEVDQLQYIMPYVEANYNVSTEAAGRAYAGLSMGGSITSNFLMYHADVFGYYGIWSYANTDGSYGNVKGIDAAPIQSYLKNLEVKPAIMLAGGSYDFGLAPCQHFGEVLDSLGIAHTDLVVPAAHDWENWQLTFAWAAQNFLFK